MASVKVTGYGFYAFRKDGEGHELRRRDLPEWRLTDAVKWALEAGCDTILIEVTGTVFALPGVTHHVCGGDGEPPGCPGGCG